MCRFYGFLGLLYKYWFLGHLHNLASACYFAREAFAMEGASLFATVRPMDSPSRREQTLSLEWCHTGCGLSIHRFSWPRHASFPVVSAHICCFLYFSLSSVHLQHTHPVSCLPRVPDSFAFATNTLPFVQTCLTNGLRRRNGRCCY